MNIINPLPMEREDGYENLDISKEGEVSEAWFRSKYKAINSVRSNLLLHTSDKINNKIRKDNVRLNSELPKTIIKKYNDYFVNMNVKIYCKSNTLELSNNPSASNINGSIKSPGRIHKKGSLSLYCYKSPGCQKKIVTCKESSQAKGVVENNCFDSRSCAKASCKENLSQNIHQFNSINKAFIKLNEMSYKLKKLTGGDIEESLLNNIKEMGKGWFKILAAKQAIKKKESKKKRTDLNIKSQINTKLSPPSSPAQFKSPNLKPSLQKAIKQENQAFSIIILSPCKKYSSINKYTNSSSPKKVMCSKRVKLLNSP